MGSPRSCNANGNTLLLPMKPGRAPPPRAPGKPPPPILPPGMPPPGKEINLGTAVQKSFLVMPGYVRQWHSKLRNSYTTDSTEIFPM